MMGLLPEKVLQKAQHTSEYFRSDTSSPGVTFKP